MRTSESPGTPETPGIGSALLLGTEVALVALPTAGFMYSTAAFVFHGIQGQTAEMNNAGSVMYITGLWGLAALTALRKRNILERLSPYIAPYRSRDEDQD